MRSSALNLLLAMPVTERRREIGMLRAVGMCRGGRPDVRARGVTGGSAGTVTRHLSETAGEQGGEASVVIAVNPTDSGSLLAAFGALGVLAVIFAESGLLVVGFFLPGDTLLFPAGVLCAATADRPPRLELWQVLVCAAVGAVAGGQVGYLIGRHGGRPLLARTSRPRVREGAVRAERLLARYGYGKALVIGRFVPMLRSVLHPAAGALGVPVRPFTVWQAVGGVLWSQSFVLAGYALGSSVSHIDRYLLPLVAVIVGLSLLPLLLEARRARRGH